MNRTLLAGALALALSSGAIAEALPYSDLPENVRAAFESHQPGVQPTQAKVESRGGETVYVIDDIEHEDILSGAGEIVQCIHPTGIDNLPASAHALLTRVYGDHEVTAVEGVYTHTDAGLVIDYLVTCTHGGESHTTLIAGN